MIVVAVAKACLHTETETHDLVINTTAQQSGYRLVVDQYAYDLPSPCIPEL